MDDLTAEWVRKALPERPKEANKGDFGKVLVIAGSEKYPGSAVLAARACYRVGAGLVTIGSSKELLPIYIKELPEATHLRLLGVFGRLGEYDVVLFGPGFGTGDEQLEFTKKLFSKFQSNNIPHRVWDKNIRMVIDADGLNNLVEVKDWNFELRGETVLTPHPGEMSKLTGLSVKEIQSNRAIVAQEFAKKWHKVVVLKGAESVVASPSELSISPFSNPGLATAGTGDVLAGVIAGFLAQGLGGFEAACVGVYVHGLAGELLRVKKGEAGIIASDVVEYLPFAIKKVKEESLDQIQFHSLNAFCDFAGPEEIKHMDELLDKLTDQELVDLTKEVGIYFDVSDESQLDRQDYEMVIDEADREDFYREYGKILEGRKK